MANTVRISKESRHRSSYVVQEVDGTRYLSTPKPPVFEDREDDIIHVIKETDRLDLLAYRYYGNAAWWWVIAEKNNIMFPLAMPDAGVRIKIPSYEYVIMEVMA